jgi:uncharacterized protein
MTGTFINVLSILVGSVIGILIGNRLPKRIQDSVMTGLGLVTLTIGLQNAMKTGNVILPLLSLVIGVILGELIGVEKALKGLGSWLQDRVARMGQSAASNDMQGRLRFINGFVTASLLFCIGPMAILGSIQNGMNTGDIQTLVIKATLDFFAATAFAASLGIGVAFSIIPTFVIQGSFTLVGVGLVGAAAAGSAASGLGPDNPFIREFTATGGLILMGLSLILLDIKQPRIANFLPALLVIPLLIWLAGLLGISIYPV